MISPPPLQRGERIPSVAEILEVVCQHTGVTVLDLKSARRARAIARPRQLVMWLARHATLHSLPEIARELGNRDHTTVMHGVQVIDLMRVADPAVKEFTDQLLFGLTGNREPQISRPAMTVLYRPRERFCSNCGRQHSNRIGDYVLARCEECEAMRRATWLATKAAQTNKQVKEHARVTANIYKRRGKLKPEPCALCLDADTVMHHRDYNRPLDVQWLCRACHAKVHREERANGAHPHP